MAEMIHPK